MSQMIKDDLKQHIANKVKNMNQEERMEYLETLISNNIEAGKHLARKYTQLKIEIVKFSILMIGLGFLIGNNVSTILGCN